MQEFPEDLRLVYRHFPLSTHDKAALATQAAEAAGLQGKFWEMHDLLFTERGAWVDLPPDQFKTWVAEKAAGLGLDAEKFTVDLNSARLVELARDAFDKNAAIGMPGTPFLMINGRYYNSRMDYENIRAVISLMFLERKQFTNCPPVTIDPAKQYIAVLKTEKGEVAIELFPEKAPIAVNNFIFLAQQGWYDGVTFHRVLPDFVAQAGDPSGTGFGGPGYAFVNEISPDLKFDGAGVVAMANAGPDSNGSQFFITYAAAPQLDGGYTIFGRVISGMEVVEKLTPRDPSEGLDLPPGDQILSIVIEEK